MKRFLSILLLGCLALALTACGGSESASDIDAIKKAGVLRVGMECDYAPFNWMSTEATETSEAIQSGGYADGYDVYFARRIAEALGVKVEVVKLEWGGLTLALQSGTIDVIIAGMSPTEERKATVDFTEPYYTGEKCIIVRADSAYASATKLSDFSGASVTAQLNSLYYNELVDQIPGVVKAQAYENTPLMLVAVEAGVVDGFIDDRDVAMAAVNVNPNLAVVRFAAGEGFTLDESKTTNAVGCRKGSDLVAFINDVLAGIPETEREQLMADARAAQPTAAE